MVAELEHSVEDTSAGFTIIENEELLKIKGDLLELRADFEDKLFQQEVHLRKQNMLLYGVTTSSDENVYETTETVFTKLFEIPQEVAAKIPLVNAHRLPSRKKQ